MNLILNQEIIARPNVAIIGARRNQQGTGNYIANHFHHQQCPIRAIVGTTAHTIEQALQEMQYQQINTRGYTDIDELLTNESIDLVAIATPPRYHMEYIEKSLDYGCNVFCEKPLYDPNFNANATDIISYATDLLDTFQQKKLHLHLNTQWIYTLDAFYQLYPNHSTNPKDIESFTMNLCPQSNGINMIVDSVPHLLSMLYTLLGDGDIEDCRVEIAERNANIEYIYRHDNGITSVGLYLKHYSGQPKPASYAINKHIIVRSVNMQDYSFSFGNEVRQIAFSDPLELSVQNCLRTIDTNYYDNKSIINGIQHLYTINKLAYEQNSL